jgi:hypothetical protein
MLDRNQQAVARSVCTGSIPGKPLGNPNSRTGTMEHSDFKINGIFYTATGEWYCTDIGTRTVIAVKVVPGQRISDGEEVVFDEFDFGGCRLSAFED